eukprot:762433-Hanusia_phi.AAC.25
MALTDWKRATVPVPSKGCFGQQCPVGLECEDVTLPCKHRCYRAHRDPGDLGHSSIKNVHGERTCVNDLVDDIDLRVVHCHRGCNGVRHDQTLGVDLVICAEVTGSIVSDCTSRRVSQRWEDGIHPRHADRGTIPKCCVSKRARLACLRDPQVLLRVRLARTLTRPRDDSAISDLKTAVDVVYPGMQTHMFGSVLPGLDIVPAGHGLHTFPA